MAGITIPPKPGLWAANQASVDPHWREFWDDLFMFIPYHGEPGQPVDKAPMVAFGNAVTFDQAGAGSFMPRWNGVVTTGDWVLGPVGPGILGNATMGNADGVKITDDGTQFRIRGNRRPMAMALLFTYDGNSADQRALLSQGGFRCRVLTDAEPTGFGSDSVAIADCIWHDELTLVMVWSDTRTSSGEDYATAVWNLEDHPEVKLTSFDEDLFGEGDPTDPIYIGAQSSNDPGEGITIYGFWAWGGHGQDPAGDGDEIKHWTTQKAEKFAEDPFGMYRRMAVAPEAAAATPSLVIRPNQYGAKLAM